MNFIKVLNPVTRKPVGFAVVEKGSQEEVMIVDNFLESGFVFEASNESEFASFGGEYVKKFSNGLFCTETPMAD